MQIVALVAIMVVFAAAVSAFVTERRQAQLVPVRVKRHRR